jgi:hypothetical protein
MMWYGKGRSLAAAPYLITPMSLQLVIPWRVALQQSSPLLHQPSTILQHSAAVANMLLILAPAHHITTCASRHDPFSGGGHHLIHAGFLSKGWGKLT